MRYKKLFVHYKYVKINQWILPFSAKRQLPGPRFRKLFSVMPDVSFLTAWYNSLVQHIACS